MDGRRERIGKLVRLERRLALEARTIAVSLQSALNQLGDADQRLRLPDGAARRREWCQRARLLLTEVEAQSARNRRAVDVAFAEWPVGTGSAERTAFRDAVREADDAIEAARSVADADRRAG